uniref:ARAD1A03806p n=1 Tax=Blastobotrys adeninivorans TaxID=409370 RepID=A0A060SWX8_BLAAD
MGLFEKFQRKASKLGLTPKAIKFLPYLSLFIAVCGVGWLFVLPIEGQYRNTYISENALMPAQVFSYFRESEWHITRGYREEIKLLESASEQERTDAVVQWFRDIGIKPFTHSWDVSYGSQSFNGTNVYGILHAPRGDSSEAMALVAPWINRNGEYNTGGVALLAALARYFTNWSVWSKNIILVVPSDSHFALRSWVSAYHTDLENTAGDIEGAVVLDYPRGHDYVEQVEISYDGLNGQLPNLDLFNTATIIANHEGMKVVIQDMDVGYSKYMDRAKTLVRGIFSQLLAGINGRLAGGENFSGWKIDTITLRARGDKGPADITSFGRIAEQTLRSINNLLEHFHQSFFFYLLLTPKKFVSIATYLPSALLVANSFPIMAIYKLVMADRTATTYHTVALPVAILTAVFMSSAAIGFGALYADPKNCRPLVTGIVATSYGVMAVGSLLPTPPLVHRSAIQHTQAYSFILHGLFLTTLAMVNFAMALVIGVLTVPLAWIRSPSPTVVARRQTALLLLSCPWTAILAFATYKSHFQARPLIECFFELFDGLFWSWRGLHVYTWAIIVGIWLPVWIIGVIVSAVQATPDVSPEKKNA